MPNYSPCHMIDYYRRDTRTFFFLFSNFYFGINVVESSSILCDTEIGVLKHRFWRDNLLEGPLIFIADIKFI